MFEGPDGSKFFSYDIKKLDEKEYFYAGQIIALSLLHDGPGFNTLNLHLCNLMLGMDSEDLVSFDWAQFNMKTGNRIWVGTHLYKSFDVIIYWKASFIKINYEC